MEQPGRFVICGHLHNAFARTISRIGSALTEIRIVFWIKGIRFSLDFFVPDNIYTARFDKFVKAGFSVLILYFCREGPGFGTVLPIFILFSGYPLNSSHPH